VVHAKGGGNVDVGERVVVTGHRGYLGRVLVPALAARGHEVHGIDADIASMALLEPVDPPTWETTADIRDVDATAFDGVSTVIHLAGLSNDPMGDVDEGLTDDINHHAAVRTARLAREQGVRRFVFASTCSLYGASDGTLLDERSPLQPVSAYARAKAQAEAAILDLAGPGFSPVALRLATLYGPSPALRTDLVVNRLTVLGRHRQCVTLDSDGRSWRPLLHVADAADVMVDLVTLAGRRVHGRALNAVGPAGNLRMADLARMVGDAVPDALTLLDPTRPADPRSYRVSGRRLARVVDAAPRRTVAQGVRGILDQLARTGPTLDALLGPGHVRLLGLRGSMTQGRIADDLRPVLVDA
jgi:nucleoside-diphosphate-sugar epimerase